MRPVLCMITDRRRFGDASHRALVERVAAAARAGVHLIQIRERDLDARTLTGLVAACVAAVRGTTARVLVNDRVDVAVAAGAHGVHLRGDSVPASRVRQISPAVGLIGRSVHSVDDVLRAAAGGGLDYLLFGTVFQSGSKPGMTAAGVEALAGAVRQTALPVLAVGGITAQCAAEVAAAGAAGFAAINFFADQRLEDTQVTVQQAALAFDTPGRVP